MAISYAWWRIEEFLTGLRQLPESKYVAPVTASHRSAKHLGEGKLVARNAVGSIVHSHYKKK